MLRAANAKALPLPDDDLVLPFRTVKSDVVGRVIRLGAVVDTILQRHAYPEPVSHALGQALALTAMLGTALKTESKLILQTKTDGPLDFLVADFVAPGKLRGYRQLRQGRRGTRGDQGSRRPGRAARQGPRRHDHRSAATTRTAIRASSRSKASRWSMRPTPTSASPSSCRPSSALPSPGTTGRQVTAASRVWRWRAGGLIVQQLPREGGQRRDDDEREDDDEENWNRARHLAATVEDHELLDPMLAARAPALPAVPRGGRARHAAAAAGSRRVPLLARAHPRLPRADSAPRSSRTCASRTATSP